MSRTIDERVVSMSFDNKQFESGVQTSLSTLDKLKKALSFNKETKGISDLENAAKNFDMSGMGNSVDNIKMKFSALDVFVAGILKNMADDVYRFGMNMANALTFEQVNAGWQKYADKTVAVQTIMSATSDQFSNTAVQMSYVNSQLEKLNWFTDETSYNFVDMVSNIGKFTANNIKLDKSVDAMQGIATWAALSGANTQQASNAMYQLSQALGSGSVRLMDWKSVENANMGTAEFKKTAIETAVALGTLKESADGTFKTLEGHTVNVEKFRDTLQHGWLSTDVLMGTLEKYGGFATKMNEAVRILGADTTTEVINVMDEYKRGVLDMDKTASLYQLSTEKLKSTLDELIDPKYDLGRKAFLAAQEAKTFGEAINAVKDAVSTGWMNTFEAIFGNYTKAKKVWTGLANELWDLFAGGSIARNNFLHDALDSGFEKLTKELDKAGISIEDFQNKVIELGKSQGLDVSKIIEEQGSLEEAFQNGALSIDLAKEAILSYGVATSDSANDISNANAKLEEFQKVVDNIWQGDYKNGEARVKALTDAGYDYALVQDLVNKSVNGHRLTLEDLNVEQMKAIGLTQEQADAMLNLIPLLNQMSGRDYLLGSIANVFRPLLQIIYAIREAWETVFLSDGGALYNTLKRIHELTSGLELSEEAVAKITSAFETFFNLLAIGGDTIWQVLKLIFDAVKVIITPFANVFEFSKSIPGITSIFTNIGSGLRAFIDNYKETGGLKAFSPKILSSIGGIATSFAEYLKSAKDSAKASGYLNTIGNGLKKLGAQGLDFAKNNWPKVVDAFSKVDWANLIKIESISSTFKKVFDTITTVFKDRSPEMKDVGKNVLAGFKEGLFSYVPKVLIFVAETFESFITLVKKIFDINSPSGKFIDIGKNVILGFIKGLKDFAGKIMETLKEIFEGNSNEYFGENGPIKSSFETGGESAMDALVKAIRDNFYKVTAVLSDLLANVNSFLEENNLDWGKLLGIGTIIYAITAFSNMNKVIDKTSNGVIKSIDKFSDIFGPLKAISKIGNAFETVGNSIAGFINTAKNNQKYKNIQILATSILILVAAVAVLAFIPSEQLQKAVSALVSIAVILAALTYGISKIPVQDVTKLSIGLAIVGASLLMIALALDMISKIPNVDSAIAAIAKVYIVVGLFIIIVGLFTSITSKFSAGNAITGLKSMDTTLIALGASMILMAFALSIVAEIPEADLERSTNVLTRLIVVLGIMSFIAGFAKYDASRVLIGFGASMILIAYALGMVAKIPDDAIGKVIAIGVGIIIALGIFSAISKLGNYVQSAEKVIVGMGVAILAIAVALWILKGLKPSEIFKGIVTIGIIMVMFNSIVKVSQYAGQHADKAGTMLLKMSIAILILVGAVYAMALLSPASIAKGLFFIGGVTLMFSLIVGLSKFAGEHADKAAKMFIRLSIAILVLVIAVYMIAMINENELIRATIALSVLMGFFAIMMFAASGLQDKGIGSLVVMGAVVLGLAYLLNEIAKLPIEQVLAAAGGLTSIFVGLGLALLAASKLGTLAPSALLAIGIMGLVMAGIAYVLYLMSENDVKNALPNAIAIGGLLLALSVSLAILGTVGLAMPAVLAGLGALTAVIIGIAVVIGLVGAFADEIEPVVDRAIPILEKVGLGLGNAIGNFVGGLVNSMITSGIDGVGEKLSEFMEQLQPFLDGLNNIKPEQENAAVTLAGIISSMAGVNVFKKERINSLVEGAKGISSMLVEFKNNISVFSDDLISRIDIAATAGKNIVDALVGFGQNGKAILGIDFEAYKKSIVEYANAIMEFNSVVTSAEINLSAIETSKQAGLIINELVKSLVNTGGILQSLIGVQDLEEFSRNLGIYGSAIVAYNNAVSETRFNLGAIILSKEAGIHINELQKDLEASGGIMQSIFGSADLQKFAMDLFLYGNAIVGYNNVVSGAAFNIEQIKLSAEAGKAIIELMQAIPMQAGFFTELFNGKQMDMVTFQSKMVGIATGLAGYASAIAGVSFDSVQASVNGAKSILDFMSSLNEYNLNGAPTFVSSLTTLATADLDGFITTYNNAGGRLSAAISLMFNNATTVLTTAGTNFSMKMKTAATTSVDSFILQTKLLHRDFYNAAVNLMNKYIDGINDPAVRAKVITTAKALVTSAANALNDNQQSAYNAGWNLVQGFVNGINGHGGSWNAAYYVGRSAVDGLNAGISARSPSREAFKSGTYFGAGFVNGIVDWSRDVDRTARDLGSKAVLALNSVVSSAKSLLDSELTISPLITPVLDLTNVSNGVRNLGSMLSGTTGDHLNGIVSSMGSNNGVNLNQNGVITSGSETNITYTQINNSPKALSRLEIYRQTKNQLTTLKGELELV